MSVSSWINFLNLSWINAISESATCLHYRTLPPLPFCSLTFNRPHKWIFMQNWHQFSPLGWQGGLVVPKVLEAAHRTVFFLLLIIINSVFALQNGHNGSMMWTPLWELWVFWIRVSIKKPEAVRSGDNGAHVNIRTRSLYVTLTPNLRGYRSLLKHLVRTWTSI